MRLPDEQPSPPSEAASDTSGASVGVELAFVLGLAALTVTIGWQALMLPVFNADGTVGPGFFPIPISLALSIGLGLYALVLARRLMSLRQSAREPDSHPPVFNARQMAILVLLTGAVLAGSTIGLFATVGLLLLTGLLTVERLKAREAIAFTIGALIVFYLVFDVWLHMNIGLSGIL